MRTLTNLLGSVAAVLLATSAHALPALQLGPDASDPDWSYDVDDETWVLDGLGGTVMAYSNAPNGSGKYAWDSAGSSDRFAYLVVAGVLTSGFATSDVFDITVVNDGAMLSLFDSGFGKPPTEDPNSLAPHGIFPTWYEIYRFQFDGPVQAISNTSPGDAESGLGYGEVFAVAFNGGDGDLEALHIDLFTVKGDGTYTPGMSPDKKLVRAFAPYSHDAEFGSHPVPEPSALLVFGAGGLVVGAAIRGRTARR